MGEPPHRDLDPVITGYYDRTPEEVRLEQGPFQLEEARTRELIHRDPMPSSAMVGDGEVQVINCGLAASGSRVGTVMDAPTYLTLEQAGGEPEQVDVRAVISAPARSSAKF